MVNIVRWKPEASLETPLKWRKVRHVEMVSDLFHKDVPFDFIDKVFAVMAMCPQHTFQVLTKRPDIMAEYLAGPNRRHHIACRARDMGLVDRIDLTTDIGEWPFPRVWLGTSVENQPTADERIPHLLRCPAAVRFVSYEPALGPVDFFCNYRTDGGARCNVLKIADISDGAPSGMQAIHWLIVGGESGAGARPFDIAWARSAIAQCKAAGVAAFCKQIGSVAAKAIGSSDPKGGRMEDWPQDIQVREFPR